MIAIFMNCRSTTSCCRGAPDIGQLQMETGLYQQALKALPQREEEFRQGEAALESIVADLVLESVA